MKKNYELNNVTCYIIKMITASENSVSKFIPLTESFSSCTFNNLKFSRHIFLFILQEYFLLRDYSKYLSKKICYNYRKISDNVRITLHNPLIYSSIWSLCIWCLFVICRVIAYTDINSIPSVCLFQDLLTRLWMRYG